MMTKMFGETPAADIVALADKLSKEMAKDPTQSSKMVMIQKGSLVALVGEIKEQLNRKFFYELGKTIQFGENRAAVIKNVPPKYLLDYQEGSNEREHLEIETNKCEHCSKKYGSIRALQGKIYFAKHPQEKHTT